MAIESISTGSVPQTSVPSVDTGRKPIKTVESVGQTTAEPVVKENVEIESEQQASQRTVEEAVKRANNKMSKTRCEFSYNKEVNRVSITVYDSETEEVIREIPPEESLKMIEKLWEIAGLMVDEKR